MLMLMSNHKIGRVANNHPPFFNQGYHRNTAAVLPTAYQQDMVSLVMTPVSGSTTQEVTAISESTEMYSTSRSFQNNWLVIIIFCAVGGTVVIWFFLRKKSKS